MNFIEKDLLIEKEFNDSYDKSDKSKIKSCDMSNKTLEIILEESSRDDNGLLAGKYELHEKLGQGSFGIVYRATDKDGKEYAVKCEELTDTKKHLHRENLIYDLLKGHQKFAKKYYFGEHNNQRMMVLERLGHSLKQYYLLKQRRRKKFDLNTVSNIAVQILYRLQELHNTGWLHQDIKPENILTDNITREKLYLVDFGTSAEWWDHQRKKHISPIRSNRMVGTARYSSLANHRGIKQCRKDDLESFGYVLIYLIKGRLPWQGIQAPDFRSKWKNIKRIKSTTSITSLCYGLPECFEMYFKYINQLNFKDTPNYSYLRKLFRRHIKSDFYWCKKSEKLRK